jgi:hypothetical protein
MVMPALPPTLSERDHAVLLDLQRVRLLSGRQLERLHFTDLATNNARGSARRRSLGRLTALGLVTTLPRRVGGERAGSAGLVYSLDAPGLRYVQASLGRAAAPRTRRPWPIGWPFVQHTLGVAELYVRLRELERVGGFRLLRLDAEPASWHRAGDVQLKPDAYVVLEYADWEQHYWLEVDRGTESLPTLRRKLLSYVEAAAAVLVGPLGVMPEVLIAVPTPARAAAVTELVAGLPAPAERLLRVELFERTFTRTHGPP